MIESYVVEEEDLLDHCMTLRKVAFQIKKIKNFLGNPIWSIGH